jgi:hypothetical protein
MGTRRKTHRKKIWESESGQLYASFQPMLRARFTVRAESG